MYGETNLLHQLLITDVGLSPRVRGNPRAWCHCWASCGSIPACTGKPTPAEPQGQPVGVYPRVYGETLRRNHARTPHHGLSPRVRGNLLKKQKPLPHVGSIPACTGKPHLVYDPLAEPAVYPRVYGETTVREFTSTTATGLSPRVRGNHAAELAGNQHTRSIPACTGEPGRDDYIRDNG